MFGFKSYLLFSTGLALGVGLLAILLFAANGPETLLFCALGWAPISLVGVFGGALAVRLHGTAGPAFPLTLLTCILLRLIFGLGGLFLATRSEQVTPYLTALFATFIATQALEMVWFYRRARLFRVASVGPAR